MKVTPTPGSVAGRRVDRAGDPLDGLVNLFDLSLVLAVGLLLAALSSANLVGIVAPSSGNGQPVSGPPQSGGETQGKGQEVGKVYRLSDGTYVFAPSGTPKAGGSTAATGAATPTGAVGGSTSQTTTPPATSGSTSSSGSITTPPGGPGD